MSTVRSVRILLVALVTPMWSVTALSHAQDQPQDHSGNVSRAGEIFERVDAGVADLTPLSVSLRNRETGLQIATSFDQLYRVPGRSDLLMRVDGGIYAVFDQSSYVRFRGGMAPVVPNNTVFHIGRPTLDLLAAAPAPDIPRSGLGAHRLYQINRIDTRIGTTNPESSVAPDDDQASMQRALTINILTNRRYRAQRLRQLMAYAASAIELRAEQNRPIDDGPELETAPSDVESTTGPPTDQQSATTTGDS